MPTSIIKTKEDERLWEKAKARAIEEDQEENWAYVMGIYKKMNPKRFKSGTAFEELVNRYAYDEKGRSPTEGWENGVVEPFVRTQGEGSQVPPTRDNQGKDIPMPDLGELEIPGYDWHDTTKEFHRLATLDDPYLVGTYVIWKGEKWMIDDKFGYPTKTLRLRKTLIVNPKKRHLDEAMFKNNVPVEDVQPLGGNRNATAKLDLRTQRKTIKAGYDVAKALYAQHPKTELHLDDIFIIAKQRKLIAEEVVEDHPLFEAIFDAIEEGATNFAKEVRAPMAWIPTKTINESLTDREGEAAWDTGYEAASYFISQDFRLDAKALWGWASKKDSRIPWGLHNTDAKFKAWYMEFLDGARAFAANSGKRVEGISVRFANANEWAGIDTRSIQLRIGSWWNDFERLIVEYWSLQRVVVRRAPNKMSFDVSMAGQHHVEIQGPPTKPKIFIGGDVGQFDMGDSLWDMLMWIDTTCRKRSGGGY